MAQTIDIADTSGVNRQDVLAAKCTVTFGSGADISGGSTAVTKQLFAIPAGAIVVGGYVNVTDATSANVDIHIQSADLAVYKADVDGAATGLTALVPTGYKYLADDTIDIMVDTANAAAAGSCDVVVQYIIDGRAAFVQK
jgi:hypothetical protein